MGSNKEQQERNRNHGGTHELDRSDRYTLSVTGSYISGHHVREQLDIGCI